MASEVWPPPFGPGSQAADPDGLTGSLYYISYSSRDRPSSCRSFVWPRRLPRLGRGDLAGLLVRKTAARAHGVPSRLVLPLLDLAPGKTDWQTFGRSRHVTQEELCQATSGQGSQGGRPDRATLKCLPAFVSSGL